MIFSWGKHSHTGEMVEFFKCLENCYVWKQVHWFPIALENNINLGPSEWDCRDQIWDRCKENLCKTTRLFSYWMDLFLYAGPTEWTTFSRYFPVTVSFLYMSLIRQVPDYISILQVKTEAQVNLPNLVFCADAELWFKQGLKHCWYSK